MAVGAAVGAVAVVGTHLIWLTAVVNGWQWRRTSSTARGKAGSMGAPRKPTFRTRHILTDNAD